MLCTETISRSVTDSGPLRLQSENPLATVTWNSRLAGVPLSGIFHSAEWARVLQKTYGFTPAYFTAMRGTRLEGVLPVMEADSWLTGKRGVSLPFTDHCEPLGSFKALRPLLQKVFHHGREAGWKYLEFRGGSDLGDLLGRVKPSTCFFGHKLHLAAAPESLFEKFETSVRRAIRKAEKGGLKVEISRSLEATRAYYRLHCRTRKQHGLPPQPFPFFRHIQEELLARDLGMVVSATHQGRVVASAIFFIHGTEAIYKFGASDPSMLHLRGNNLVMWEGIKALAARGARTLDFGRTSLVNEGLRRFKQGWGSDEVRIQYFKFDLRKDCFVSQADEAVGWHSRVFRNLPMFAARWAGAMLYKHVA